MTEIASIGNSGANPQHLVNPIKLASITVGGYSIGTLYPTAASPTEARVIDSISSWQDPTVCNGGTSCDRERPHVVAHMRQPGLAVAGGAYKMAPSTQGNSYSSPQIGGLAALMEGRWPGHFYAKPEAIKATLMASATRDIDTPMSGKTFSDFIAPDEKDGAGAPDAERIESIAQNNRVITKTQEPWDYTNGQHLWQSVYLSARQTIRVVLAQSCCDSRYSRGDKPHTDLDIKLRQGFGGCNGTQVNPFIRDPVNGGSRVTGHSYNNEYEIVEFSAARWGRMVLYLHGLLDMGLAVLRFGCAAKSIEYDAEGGNSV